MARDLSLWVFSDLHLTHEDIRLDAVEADVAVVAGDVDVPLSTALMAVRLLVGPDMKVVYVPGNHDWYAVDMIDELARGRSMSERMGVHLLLDEEVVIGGVRFLGSTLWTDYELYGRPRRAMKRAAREMNDHQCVSLRGRLFTPGDALDLHRRSRRWLEQSLAAPHDGPTVVVTHHAPHEASIAPQWRGHDINPAFASDLGKILRGPNAPDLWIHGHMHAGADHVVARTRVLCNPKGYVDENPGFDPAMVVTVPVIDRQFNNPSM